MRILFLLCLIFLSNLLGAQTHTISGFVQAKSSGEKLIGANVYDKSTYTGVSTNVYGFYSLTLPEGDVSIEASFVGFHKLPLSFKLSKDTTIIFKMGGSNELNEVEIVASQAEKIQEASQMSAMTIPIQTIEKIPMLLGEADVMKALQLLPGVQSGSEGSSGLYVRGGGPDQNLILLDGVPVYNASHLFGFFSVFNPDALNHVELIKGGFPAHYGGRLSSVIDIRMKEGNNQEFHGSGSVGIISSKLTLEGPLIKDKASFLISGRRTYIDLLARPIIKAALKSNGAEGVAGYYFYDLNAKVNYKISEKDRVFLSAYTGDDRFYFDIAETYRASRTQEIRSEVGAELAWGNLTGALRYNRVMSNKLFMNLTATYSRYNFGVGQSFVETSEPSNPDLDNNFRFNYNSGINDWSGRIDFDYMPTKNHLVKFGGGDIYHTFTPGIQVFKAQSSDDTGVDTTFGANRIFAHEYFLYVEDDFKIGNRLKINAGLHFSGFLDSKNNFYSLQPRFSGRYLITELLSFKASYAEMQQYIHLLTNATIGLPTDLWVPSTERIKPEYSRQIAAGLAYTFKETYEISLEGYYKWMSNLIEYKDGASFFNDAKNWQDQVEVGRGWSYGIEAFVQKKVGKTSGWIGYTLSWTERQFDNLNFGEPFPYRYDRRHDLSIVLTHEINENFDIGAAWVYGTGNAVSLPLESYLGASNGLGFGGNQPIDYYESRNGYRMRAYHRLDFGANFHKKKKHWDRTISIGAYNAYSRRNPFFLYFQEEYFFDDLGSYSIRNLTQVSLFPIIPYISYGFKF
jgi:outer membrane receptor for ferrienterochelin and colicin